MKINEMFSIVTFVVTLIIGFIAKKHPRISNKIIPIQNLAIGVIMAIIEFIITKDFKVSIAVSGLLAGGTYDIVHNLNKLKEGE